MWSIHFGATRTLSLSLSSCNCRRSTNKYLQINQLHNLKDILHAFQLSDMLLYLKHPDINILIHAAGAPMVVDCIDISHAIMNPGYEHMICAAFNHSQWTPKHKPNVVDFFQYVISSIVLWNSPHTILQFLIFYIPPPPSLAIIHSLRYPTIILSLKCPIMRVKNPKHKKSINDKFANIIFVPWSPCPYLKNAANMSRFCCDRTNVIPRKQPTVKDVENRFNTKVPRIINMRCSVAL